MSSFQETKAILLNNLEKCINHLIFPQKTINLLKTAGLDTFASHAKNYSKTLIKCRTLYDELSTLEKFGWLANSEQVWTFSVNMIAGKLIIYRNAMIQECKPSSNFVSQALFRQSGLNMQKLSIFLLTKKNNGKYEVCINNNNTKILTYDQVKGLLPRPVGLVDGKVGYVDCGDLSLDSSDIIMDI